ncbi:LysR family transcriptional regulator [Methylocystis bryophila]|uniref:LysR family transcriptional regulator n=1 Tax=Methylocystis bryophila TaxID=655015 RepID=A0A1W6N1L3_9HYPH|nr:LysR family transcriptional regulator [Methylocystis bryophila]ARN83708.1 LysR family transcriptional regulator [Methylocystis bryophila]BDV38490.1 transcriptional regulator [Methylocystis bryophila]
MDTKRIDLNLLVTLEALLATRNVTKAAARLHLSQPAVSAQLNRLRALFEDPLLVPAHRGMTPTVKALELLDPLRQALDQLRGTMRNHKDFAPESAAFTLTIACSDYLEAVIVGPLVLALRREAPRIRVAVRRLSPQQLEPQLASGEIDLAIAMPDGDAQHLRKRRLFDESYVLIGRRDHPKLKAAPTIEDYVRLEHVIVSRQGGGFTTPVDEALAALGHRRNVVLSAASFLFLPEIVATSDLVALAPRRLLQAHRNRLTIIEPPWLSERFEVALLWHERSHAHAGSRWIRERIVRLAAEGKESRPAAPKHDAPQPRKKGKR